MWSHTLSHQELHRLLRSYAESRPCCLAARWRARSFAATEGEPMTLRRARALNAVLDQCDLPLWPGELLIGLGWFARMAPAGAVTPEEMAHDEQCLAAVGARTFTTHSDHLAPDYPTLLATGFGDLRDRVRRSLAEHRDPDRRVFLESVLVALDGASRHLLRWASRLREASLEHRQQADLLLAQAEMMEHLAERPASTFWEALQLVYSFHCMMQLDERYAMAFGRLDQYLYPFYRADLEVGRLDKEGALRLFEHFFAKVTAPDDIQNIAIGGVRPEDGSDATNELSYLILEACRRVRRPGGNVTARIHPATPSGFLRKCAEVIRTGVGYPAVFNDEIEIPALVAQGYPLEAARDYCFVGCIEAFIPGRMAPWADGRFNLLRCVNLALYAGTDSLTGQSPGLRTGEPESWPAFYQAFQQQMRAELRDHIEALNAAKRVIEDRAADYTSPLMSALVADCIERGRDLNDGGARYPANHGIAGMGIGTTADSLAAIKTFVYDQPRFTLADLRGLLDANFEGCERERQLLLRRAPKYGNDDDLVDGIAARVTRDFGEECLKYANPQGGHYWGLMAANVQNIQAGREVAATPDGRLSQQPLSDAASPTFGRDTHGLTAVIRSVAKLPYATCPGGNVINIKLHPSLLRGDEGLHALAALIRTCFDLGGVQLQFNTVDRELLREALQRPHDYQHLVVRVSGFSAYFVSLDRAVQDDILARTEHAPT